MKKILLISVFIFFMGSINAQTKSGVGKYNASFKELSNRQTGDSDKVKVRKKLSKYFEKMEYDKAEEYATKVMTKNGKIVYVLLADNYFLKGKQELGDENYKEAIVFFKKALLFYKNGDYITESQFVKRDLGICYLNLFKENLTDDNLIVSSYDNFISSNSSDLIEKYNDYFAVVYLKLYKATFKDEYLEKAFESCSNNENINQFKKPCANTAEALFNDYKAKMNNKDNLEKSIVMYKRLNMQTNLDETNEALANYYIDKTKKPELAYEYLNRVMTMNFSKLDSYTRKIDGKLISYCYTVDDCIALADRKPELKEQVFPRAIEVAKTMEDCDKLYRYYPSKKSDVKSKALSLIKTIDDCQEAYNYFPSKKSEIGALAIKLANSYKQLGYIYLQFDNIANDAETKALYNIVDIDDKKEFVQYFPNSSFSSDIQKEIDVEEALDAKMDMTKESMNELIMNTYAEGKKCEQVSSSINYEEEENMVIGVSYKFIWSVYFNARPIVYKIDIKARLYLEDGSCVIGKVNLLMDDDVQELDLFNTIKPKLVSIIKTFIGDLTTLNTLKEKRKISYEVPQYYKFTSVVSASEEELSENVGSDDDEVEERPIFQVVETMPEFSGGRSAMMKYLATNINYPPYAKEAGIQGRVFINFVVEPNGSITSIKVLRGIGGGCDEEAIRVVKNMPKWKPGMQRGKPVRVSFNLPVKFTLQ